MIKRSAALAIGVGLVLGAAGAGLREHTYITPITVWARL